MTDDTQAGGDRRTRRRHPAARARLATAGVGIAAMVGLAANMQIASGRVDGADSASTSAPPPQKTVVIVHKGVAKPGTRAAKAAKPIVLTAHAVVRTVPAPSGGASTGSAGYAAAAPEAAPPAAPAAPVASTSGSR